MTAATSRLRRRGIGAGVAALVGLTGLGFAAVPAQAAPSFEITRPTDTADRFETAASVALASFPSGADNVIIANGDNAVDALAASYLAGTTIPILYVSANSIPDATQDALDALDPSTTWIVGGTTAVSAAVEADLPGTVERVDGATRYETAANIAQTGYDAASTKPTSAFIARGDSFADALAIAPYAAKAGVPVLLTETGSLSDAAASFLADNDITDVTILGGTSAVSSDVEDELTDGGFTVDRVEGATRQETAVAIATDTDFAFGNTAVTLVNGWSPVDALPASVWAAQNNSPIILTEGATLGAAAEGYLDDNSDTLVTGFAVGGTSVIPDTVVAAASEAAGAMEASSLIVTGVSGSAVTYADPITKAPVTVTVTDADTFSVDGTASSRGVFTGAVTTGDTLVITPGTGTVRYDLTNVTAATAYTSGLVGTGSTATNVNIAEPVTGATVNTLDLSTTTYNVYQLNGTTTTSTAFAANLNPGDTISVTGTGADASNLRTINLVDATVSGTVTAKTATTVTFKTTAGAVFTTPTIVDGDTKTSDGTAVATAAGFTTLATVGDQVTYSRTAGVQTLALVNAASTPITGIVPEGATLGALQAYVGTATTLAPSAPFNATAAVLTVNGARVTGAEFTAALSAGDQVTITQPDGAIDTVGSVALTNKTLSGPVGGVNTGSDTLDIFSAAGVTGAATLANDINYVTNFFYTGNVANTYFVNGTTATLTEFETALTSVGNGSSTGTIELVDNGTTTEWRVATTAVTAAPTLVSAAIVANTTGADTVTLVFSKPVYFSAAPAAGDVTYGSASNAVSGVSPTFAGTASNTVTFTVANTLSAVPSPATASFTLTAQGAAKIKDVNGVAVAAATTVVATVS